MMSGGLPQNLLLDLYPGAAAAFSVRKLRTAYTGSAIRVRRASDNTEQNIGFDGLGNLDASALTTFCTGTNGFVTTWFDQSGNNRNATQTTAINQPQIISSGSVISISGVGSSKPALSFDNTNDLLTIQNSKSSFSFLHSGTQSFYAGVLSFNSNNASATFGNNSGTSLETGVYIDKNNLNKFVVGITNSSGNPGTATAIITTTSTITANSQLLLSVEFDAANLNQSNRIKAYINNGGLNGGNTLNGSASPLDATQDFQFGSYGGNSGFMNGHRQEEVFWALNQSANFTGIKNNINSYYGIY